MYEAHDQVASSPFNTLDIFAVYQYMHQVLPMLVNAGSVVAVTNPAQQAVTKPKPGAAVKENRLLSNPQNADARST